MEQDLLLTGAAGKDREGKQRQRRQTKTGKARKTEKANKDREGKKDREGRQRQRGQKRQTGLFKKYSYLTTADGQLPYKESARNTASRTLNCYGTCQCSALLNGVFVSRNGFPVRVVSFLIIIVSV